MKERKKEAEHMEDETEDMEAEGEHMEDEAEEMEAEGEHMEDEGEHMEDEGEHMEDEDMHDEDELDLESVIKELEEELDSSEVGDAENKEPSERASDSSEVGAQGPEGEGADEGIDGGRDGVGSRGIGGDADRRVTCVQGVVELSYGGSVRSAEEEGDDPADDAGGV